MRNASSIVLTSREIYRLYIKPSSKMEVNIPGRMRKELVNLFEQKKRNSTRRGMSFIGKLVRQVTRNNTQRMQPQSSISGLSRNSMVSNPRLKSQRTLFRDSNVYKSSRDDSQNFSMHRHSTTQHSGTECLIDHLYPAWKALVNLLNSDSLVRFKMGHEGKTELRGILR